ncbi:MAG: hypothetical protein IJS09_06520 [Treponema sp.]|nr:hypothetical protein [Treponema sp.]
MDFDNLGETVRDFVHEKPLISTMIGIFVLLFFASLIIILIQTSKPEVPTQTFRKEPFTADAKLLIPAAPEAEKDYYPSRTIKNAWTEEDIEPWFTKPDEETLKNLEKANDAIVSDIIGAAP